MEKGEKVNTKWKQMRKKGEPNGEKKVKKHKGKNGKHEKKKNKKKGANTEK